MSRFRKIFFWTFVVVALGAGVFAYFNLKNSKKPQLNAVSVLPDSCLVYFNTNNLAELSKKVNSQSLIFDQLNSIKEIDVALNSIQEFDSIVNSNNVLKEELSKTRIHLAYYPSAWLLTFNLKQLGEQNKFKELIRDSLGATAAVQDVFQLHTQQHTKLFFQLYKGVVIISNSQALIGKALSSTSKKLEKSKAFSAYSNTLNEDNVLSVFVNHDLIEKDPFKKKLNLNYIFKTGTSVANIDFQPSQVILNGYLCPSKEEVLNAFKDQDPQASKKLGDYLPSSVVYFKAFGFNSYTTLRNKLDKSESNQNYWESVNKKALYNLKNEFNENAGNHVITIKNNQVAHQIVCFEIQDTVIALEHLILMSDSVFKTDSLEVYQLDSLNSLALFKPLINAKTPFAMLHSSHIYFSEDKQLLIACVRDLQSNRIFSNDISYTAYQNQHFPDEFNYLIYCSPKQLLSEIPEFFNYSQIGNKNPFENLKHFSFCASRHSNDFKFRMQLMHESENKLNNEQFLWTLKLDTNAVLKAQKFVNHNTKENEVLIQDEKNILYLINAKGSILWKKKINERIISEIFMVDMYKNGKYQIVFNTKSALHLIDRNGNYVETYPVQLPSEATNAMNLFDYENDKEYRILIACKNNMIYNYTIHGQKHEKFISVKTDTKVQLPVQYVKIGQSDYLVAVDIEGKIYTFSRKGIGRIGLRNRCIVNCKAFYCDLNNTISSSYLVYVDDKNGLINKISFDDRKEIVKLDDELENAGIRFSLIDDNRSMDLIVTKGSAIWSYNFSGNLISEQKLETNLVESDYYKDESHAFYYSLSEDRGEVYLNNLLSQKIQKYKATLLPMVSNLFKDNKTYLIMSNGAQLSCVPIN